MEHRVPHSKPAGVQVLLAVLLAAGLMAAYVAILNTLVDLSDIENGGDADRRDLAYAYLHVGLLIAAAVGGFLLGKWLNGLGFAYATLFVIVLAVGMVGVQMASYELACHGHNDLVRHWQC